MSEMTRKEAIEVLDDMKVKIDIPHAAVMQRKRNEALDMAISALSDEKIKEARDTLLRLRHEVGYIRKKDIEDAFAGIVEDEK